MPGEPEPYFGSNLAAALCGLNNTRVERKLGEPDAIMRYGALDCCLWRCERVTQYAFDRQWTPGAENPPVYYTRPEASRFVGVGWLVLKRILGKTPAPARCLGLLAPARSRGGSESRRGGLQAGQSLFRGSLVSRSRKPARRRPSKPPN